MHSNSNILVLPMIDRGSFDGQHGGFYSIFLGCSTDLDDDTVPLMRLVLLGLQQHRTLLLLLIFQHCKLFGEDQGSLF
jgi:hypothetical protein